MESIKTDVLIIGAGPAGAAAAIRLSQTNVNVTLVDKSHFPRAKVCGDGLTPKAITLLRRLGIEATSLSNARRFVRVSLIGPDNSVSTITLKRLNTIAY